MLRIVRLASLCVCCLGMFLLAMPSASASEGISFTIVGQITDKQSGESIEGATVETRRLTGDSCGWTNKITRTGSDGRFRFEINLPSANICDISPTVFASADGYEDGLERVPSILEAGVNESVRIDTELERRPGGLETWAGEWLPTAAIILLVIGLGTAYVAGAVAVANAAVRKGRNYEPWLWISLGFGVILPAVVMATLKDERQTPLAGATRPPQTTSEKQVSASISRLCPFCAEEIKVEAIKCKHCGEYLSN